MDGISISAGAGDGNKSDEENRSGDGNENNGDRNGEIEIDSACLVSEINSESLVSKTDSTSLVPKIDSTSLVPEIDSTSLVPEIDSTSLVPEIDSTSLVPEIDSTCPLAIKIDLTTTTIIDLISPSDTKIDLTVSPVIKTDVLKLKLPISPVEQKSSVKRMTWEWTVGRLTEMSKKAISRAVAEGIAGDFYDAIFTLNTAIYVSRKCPAVADERGMVILNSLECALEGIECRKGLSNKEPTPPGFISRSYGYRYPVKRRRVDYYPEKVKRNNVTYKSLFRRSLSKSYSDSSDCKYHTEKKNVNKIERVGRNEIERKKKKENESSNTSN